MKIGVRQPISWMMRFLDFPLIFLNLLTWFHPKSRLLTDSISEYSNVTSSGLSPLVDRSSSWGHSARSANVADRPHTFQAETDQVPQSRHMMTVNESPQDEIDFDDGSDWPSFYTPLSTAVE